MGLVAFQCFAKVFADIVHEDKRIRISGVRRSLAPCYRQVLLFFGYVVDILGLVGAWVPVERIYTFRAFGASISCDLSRALVRFGRRAEY